MKAAQAQDCSLVNLITQKNSPFQKIPVDDQEENGLCYSYVGAQLLNYKYIKAGAPDKLVHYAWVAYRYARSRKKNELSNGHIDEAVSMTLVGRNCDYQSIDSSIKSWARALKMTESQMLKFLDDISNKAEEIKKKTNKKKLSRPEFEGLFAEVKGHENSNPKAILPLIESLGHLEAANIFEAMIQPACKNAMKKLPYVDVEYNSYRGNAKSKFKVQNSLNLFQSPAAITYCSNIWTDPSFKNFSDRKDDSKKCDVHASLVVGKKVYQNSCHYLVRNTWGSNWRYENQQWKCLCRKISDGSFEDNCQMITHWKDKYIVDSCWIPEDVLLPNIHSVTTVK